LSQDSRDFAADKTATATGRIGSVHDNGDKLSAGEFLHGVRCHTALGNFVFQDLAYQAYDFFVPRKQQ
jgi:hypothetical protein